MQSFLLLVVFVCPQIVSVYAASVVILGRPFGFDVMPLGAALLGIAVSMLFFAVVLQAKHGSAKREVEQQILEQEARETDLKLSFAELMGNSSRLRTSTLEEAAFHKLKNVDETVRHENHLTVAVQVAVKKRFSLRGTFELQKKDGFNLGLYPCFVVEYDTLLTFEKLPFHEDAIKAGLMEELKPTSRCPSPSHSFFISQVSGGLWGHSSCLSSHRACCLCVELGRRRWQWSRGAWQAPRQRSQHEITMAQENKSPPARPAEHQAMDLVGDAP